MKKMIFILIAIFGFSFNSLANEDKDKNNTKKVINSNELGSKEIIEEKKSVTDFPICVEYANNAYRDSMMNLGVSFVADAIYESALGDCNGYFRTLQDNPTFYLGVM